MNNPQCWSTYPAPRRILLFLLILVGLWLPFFLLSHLLARQQAWGTTVSLVVLYGEFLALARWWGRQVHGQTHVFRHYGLEFSPGMLRNWLVGILLGWGSVLMLFGLQGVVGWLTWQSPTLPLLRLLLEGMAVGCGIGFAEELFFRGWFLSELERDYRPIVSLLVSSFVFALLHFIKPLAEIVQTLPQFAGLLVLGMALVWARRATQGRLGLAIGLHGGLVWAYYLVNVGAMVQPTRVVPDWITGINRNPLAGVLGVGCLATIAAGLRLLAHEQASRSP